MPSRKNQIKVMSHATNYMLWRHFPRASFSRNHPQKIGSNILISSTTAKLPHLKKHMILILTLCTMHNY